MMNGEIAGAVAGAAQPGRSSGTLGAVWHAAAVEAPGEPAGPLAVGEGFGLQAAAARAMQTSAMASVTERGFVLGIMPTAYPWCADDGAARTARIRGRHPEDR